MIVEIGPRDSVTVCATLEIEGEPLDARGLSIVRRMMEALYGEPMDLKIRREEPREQLYIPGVQ